MGPNVTRPVPDPLAVLSLDNWLSIYNKWNREHTMTIHFMALIFLCFLMEMWLRISVRENIVWMPALGSINFHYNTSNLAKPELHIKFRSPINNCPCLAAISGLQLLLVSYKVFCLPRNQTGPAWLYASPVSLAHTIFLSSWSFAMGNGMLHHSLATLEGE